MASRLRKTGTLARIPSPWHSLALLAVLTSCVVMVQAGSSDATQASGPPNAPPRERTGSDNPQPAAQPAQPDEQQRAADRESLIKLIRERAEAARKAAAEGKPTTTRPHRQAVPAEIREARRTLQRQRLGQTPTSRPARKEAGCGKGGQALTPPPADAPQPKFVCQQPVVEMETVWKGQKLTFPFVIANEGEGPLQIRLKRG